MTVGGESPQWRNVARRGIASTYCGRSAISLVRNRLLTEIGGRRCCTPGSTRCWPNVSIPTPPTPALVDAIRMSGVTRIDGHGTVTLPGHAIAAARQERGLETRPHGLAAAVRPDGSDLDIEL